MPLNPYRHWVFRRSTLHTKCYIGVTFFTENFPETGEPNASEILTLKVNYNFTYVFSRREGILPLGNPRHTYVRKNLREASVKVNIPREHL